MGISLHSYICTHVTWLILSVASSTVLTITTTRQLIRYATESPSFLQFLMAPFVGHVEVVLVVVQLARAGQKLIFGGPLVEFHHACNLVYEVRRPAR